MKIRIKRLDKTLSLPAHQTASAAAFDLSARLETIIPPRAVGYVPLNVIIATPPGYVLNIFSRSGTHKKGLMLANGVGVIDPDFCGEEDEIRAAYYNFTDQPVKIERGERIAQGIVKKREDIEWEEVEKMENPSRGGFGSTGVI